MTTMTTEQHRFELSPVLPGDDRFVALAAEHGAELAARAEQYDRENRFISENLARLRTSGYLALAVPEELGGLGASLRQVCFAQAELARYCGSTGLAVNMHVYLTLAQAWGWRHGNEAAGRTLRRVAEEGLLLMTSGGSDGIWPSGTAARVDGGFQVSGRKVFCSLAPEANVLSTMAAYDDPEAGRVVLALAIPMSSPGVQVLDNWDTLGMRGTSSHDVQLTDVFVPDERVAARRPWGRNDPFLRNALFHFAPTVASVYLGIAIGARDAALQALRRPRRPGQGEVADNALLQRQVGLIEYQLQTAWWSLLGALNALGDDPRQDEATINRLQLAKRHVVTAAVEIVDQAMELVGGSTYFRGSSLERAYRDVRAGTYHPFTPEKSLLYAGRLALELPVDQIW